MEARIKSPGTLRAVPPFATAWYGAVAAAGVALVLAACVSYGWNETGTQLAARYTARFSALLFVVVFVSRPLFNLWRTDFTRDLLRRRRQLGLGFALAHGIHLLAIVAFFIASGAWFGSGDIPAGLTYLFIALMAVTSNDASVRRLGRWWKRLHRTGIWAIFLTFSIAYGGRVFGGYGETGETPAGSVPAGWYAAHATVFALLMGGLALRLAAALTTRRRRQTAPAGA